MSDLLWLSEAQMRRIEPYFPLAHGMPRVDDRRVISGIELICAAGVVAPCENCRRGGRVVGTRCGRDAPVSRRPNEKALPEG